MLRIISFFQEGCMACEEQEPINPLKERSNIEEYKLQVTPTTIILSDGKVVERFEGVVHREQLVEAIRKYL